jgi:hypothetical protein
VLAEEAHLVGRKTASGVQKIRPSLEGAPKRRGAAPPFDPAVITATQNLRDFPAPEHGRTRVLRVLQQPGREALVTSGGGIAEHPWNQPGRGLDDDEGRQLTAGEHEVAHRELTVDEVVGNPLVHTLITPAEK